jgi:hypothetical protein
MPLNSAMFWKVRAMPGLGRLVGVHVPAVLAAEDDVAFLRPVDAVDDVEHRALAGAVGADDGANFMLAHIEGNVRQRLDPAETQRNVLQVEDHLADLPAFAHDFLVVPMPPSSPPATGRSSLP